jgi:HPt (histidine-containing phosphotransfer) domain-containing protein
METIYIDMADGLQRVMHNKQLYMRLLSKFRTGTSLQALSSALADEDYETAQIEVHTIKGTAGNLSLTALFRQAQDLNAKIKDKLANPAGEEIPPEAVKQLLACFDSTLLAIDKVLADHA